MTSEPTAKPGLVEAVSERLDQLGTELILLGDNTADLASIVSIVEHFSTLKETSEKQQDEPAFQVGFACEETLSSVLCERFPNPAEPLAAVRKAFEDFKAYIESHKEGKPDPALLQESITHLFELLEVPVVSMQLDDKGLNIIEEEASADEPEAPMPDAPAEEETPAQAPPAPPGAPVMEASLDEDNVTTGLPQDLEDAEIYKEFVFECSEHLETIEEKILDLETSPDDIDLINEIFRPIHSMKGGAGFLALLGMQKLAHDTETLLDKCRKRVIAVTPTVVELCLKSVDALKQMVANLTAACESENPNAQEVPPIIIGPIRQAIQKYMEDPDADVSAALDGEAPEAAPAQTPPAPAPQAAPPAEPEADLNDPEYASNGLPPRFGDEDDIDLCKRFLVQCYEHLENIEEYILQLENNPEDEELLNAIFRAMHSIKGDAGFLELDGFAKLAHNTETLLDRCRKKKLRFTDRVTEFCLASKDALKKMAGNLSKALELPNPLEADVQPVVYGPIRNAINAYLDAPSQEEAEEKISLEDAFEQSDETPPPRLGEILVREGYVKEEEVDLAVAAQQGMPLGEILVKQGKVTTDKVDKALTKQAEAGGAGAAGATARAIKVDTEKIDLLVNLVGELVIIEAQVAQMAQQANAAMLAAGSTANNGNGNLQVWEKNLSQLGKITKELQDRSMSLRMMPIRQTFQKMTRLVRDASKKMKKKVQLQLSGEDTELDKNVVEQIGDPLVHMLRNSVDHGIESPADRVAAGKPEMGTIHLRAYYQGDRIMIEVTDDGKGLDKERLLEKALENDLIQEGQNLTDKEIFMLIFQPGFSTAKEITDISGRGVGMDVVKRNIDKLRGNIEVESEKGKGTTVRIGLPLTLAIIDGMVIRVGEEEYIIPTASIQESMRPKKEEISTVTNRGEMINVRGNLVPLIRLYDMWGIQPQTQNPCESLVVIVENKGQRGCVMVDELVGQQQIVIKNLGEQFGEIRGITGATILGSGRVGLILDVDGILDRATNG